MKGTVSTKGKRALRNSSRSEMVACLHERSPVDRRTKWINKNNRYRINCTKRLEKDLKARTVNHLHLASYIAASGACHVIDGWAYLGRALDAVLRGDQYAAIHLGYYAELRAAMGLLACEGVGILNTKHATVDASRTTHNEINQGTHKIIWPCVKHWSTMPKAASTLDAVFQPGGISLGGWLSGLGGTVPAKAIARHWLGSWGVDLVDYDYDHDVRNLVSYRPSEFRCPDPQTYEHTSLFIEQLWRSFEPTEGSRFPVVDGHLLKRALKASGVTFPLTLARLTGLGLGGAEAAFWLTFLNSGNEPAFLAAAEIKSPVESEHCHLQVVSRATLLLYLATSVAREQFRAAGYTRSDLRFWWERYGNERGLWGVSTVPDDPMEIWADVRDILTDIDSYRTAHTGNVSIIGFRKELCRQLEMLGAWELVAVWGLLP